MKQAFATATGGAMPQAGQAPAIELIAHAFPNLEILELLGAGGMGAVYKARQKHLDRFVALKIMLPEMAKDVGFAERFTREARTLAKLNHPNLVTLYDFGESDGLYYFLMEFVDGVSLRRLIADKQLTPEQALTVVPKICDALQFAHDAGVMHRDIKPDNILVDKTGRVKIADFGLAKIAGRTQGDVTLTGTGIKLGTVRYMAPEQLEDTGAVVDHRADIYALGVVIYEMLTGELPLGRFALPSQKVQVDVRMDEIVLHALEKEPARRYQHASEIKTDVENVTGHAAPMVPKAAPASGETPKTQAAQADAISSSRDLSTHRVKLPILFWIGLFGFMVVAWLGIVAAFRWHFPGVIAASLLAGAVLWEILFRAARRDPLWREAWQKTTRLQRLNLATAVPGFALLFVMIVGGASMQWDNGSFEHNLHAPLPQKFEIDHKGKEYQLIRRLPAFNEQIPNVELSLESYTGSWSPTGSRTATAAALILICTAGLALMLHQFFGPEALKPWKMRHGQWHQAGQFAGLLFLSEACAYGLISFIFILRIGHAGGKPETWTEVNQTLMVQSPMSEVSARIQKWAETHGYESRLCRWALNTVPRGELVARTQVMELWKKDASARWQMNGMRPELIHPTLAVQIVSSEKPAESEVMIYGGGGLNNDGLALVGSEREKLWRGVVQNLADAAEGKNTKMDPAIEALAARVSQPEDLTSAPYAIYAAMALALLALLPSLKRSLAGRASHSVVQTTSQPAIDGPAQLGRAATGLLIAGILDAAAGLIWIGASLNGLADAIQHGLPVTWPIIRLLASLCSIAVVYYTVGSGLYLLRRNDYGDITFPLIMAAIAPPGFIVGMPAAIYALILLSKPEVKALFPGSTPENRAS